MGVIEFVQDVGRRLGVGDTPPAQSAQAPATPPGPEAQQAAALMRLVEQMGLTVEPLGIQVDGERVTLTGTTDRQETREKVVLLVGNVQGVGQVDDPLQVAQPAPEARLYTVKRGDTLSQIAQAHDGDATQYPWIFEANRPLLRDPDEIYPGQTLRIPPSHRMGAAELSLHAQRAAPLAGDLAGVRRRPPGRMAHGSGA
jgi:LysM repeat protein